MAFAYSRLTEITTIGTSAAAVLTNASGNTTYVRLIVIHNGNTSAEAVKLYNVPDSSGSVGTAAAANLFHQGDGTGGDLSAGATIQLEYAAPGLILTDANDTIQAVTDTADKVTIQIFGAVE